MGTLTVLALMSLFNVGIWKQQYDESHIPRIEKLPNDILGEIAIRVGDQDFFCFLEALNKSKRQVCLQHRFHKNSQSNQLLAEFLGNQSTYAFKVQDSESSILRRLVLIRQIEDFYKVQFGDTSAPREKKHSNALLIAARKGYKRVAQYCVRENYNLNIIDEESKETPVLRCVQEGHEDILEMFLRAYTKIPTALKT